MLVEGHLNHPLVFETSSGVRGKTLDFQREESEDIVVVDTVGFGEADHGSVTDAEAQNKLYDFFIKINEEKYNFLAFVQKWGKLDELDAHLWAFFKQAFEGASKNYVLIFTHCSPQALKENGEDIKVAFDGCERYITVDFPAPSDKPASAKSRRNDKLRTSSLKRLLELLDEFMLPSIIPCLRSTMMKGRVLVMGTAKNARNMVSKLLVDGIFNMTSMSCIEGLYSSTTIKYCSSDSDSEDVGKAFGYYELEGRGWQVVNVTVLDTKFICSFCKSRNVIHNSANFADIFASKLSAILHHGTYSHCIYVEDCEDKDVVDEMVPKKIISMLKQVGIKNTVAVIVNPKEDVSYQDAGKFKEWHIICQFHLPTICKASDLEREHKMVQRYGLGTLEEALSATGHVPLGDHDPFFKFARRSTPASVSAASESEASESDASPFESPKLKVMYEISLNTLAQTFKALNQFRQESGMYKSSTNALGMWSSINASVFRMPFKHVVAELQYKPLNADVSVEALYIFVSKAGSDRFILEGLSTHWIWGELQILDKHLIDRKIARLPLFVGNREDDQNQLEQFVKSTGVQFTRNPPYSCNIWCIGNHDANEREFINNISDGDTIVLWLYPNPHSRHAYMYSYNVEKFDIGFGWAS